MRYLRNNLGLSVVVLAAAVFASPACADTWSPSHAETMSASFQAGPPAASPAASADPLAAPSVVGPSYRPDPYAQPAAPVAPAEPVVSPAARPGAGDGLYVDWVSPLQAPRGASPADFPTPADAFDEVTPAAALPASEKGRSPLSIPESNTLRLIGTALLPMLGLFLRRRR